MPGFGSHQIIMTESRSRMSLIKARLSGSLEFGLTEHIMALRFRPHWPFGIPGHCGGSLQFRLRGRGSGVETPGPPVFTFQIA